MYTFRECTYWNNSNLNDDKILNQEWDQQILYFLFIYFYVNIE